MASPDQSRPAPLLFPCVICAQQALFRATRAEFLKFHGAAPSASGRWPLKFMPGAEGPQAPIWLLDRSGAFRAIQVVDVQNRWASGLRWLWDFTSADCELAPPQWLTASAWLEKLAPLKDTTSTPVVAKLRSFLKPLPANQKFEAQQFKDYWAQSGYPLTPEQWQEQLP